MIIHYLEFAWNWSWRYGWVVRLHDKSLQRINLAQGVKFRRVCALCNVSKFIEPLRWKLIVCFDWCASKHPNHLNLWLLFRLNVDTIPTSTFTNLPFLHNPTIEAGPILCV